ncbi:Phosducin-like protein 3 [Cucumispora dikerogammari]|nr:Phosducin-like protein 3 [Cucumispora dikerogammari]
MHELESSSDDNKVISAITSKRYKELKTILLPSITEIPTEEIFISKSKTEKMIVHFYSSKFKLCEQMNLVLKEIVKDYKNIGFYKIDAEKCPLVCSKLRIGVLPFLGFFKGGYFVGSQIGFEGIGDVKCDVNQLRKVINKSELAFLFLVKFTCFIFINRGCTYMLN